MHYMIIMPVWQLLLLVVGVAAFSSSATGVPCSYFAARRGARMAIEICAKNWDCKMTKAGPRALDSTDLEEKLAALRRAHPELAAVQEAMRKADSDSVGDPTHSQEKIDHDGHEG